MMFKKITRGMISHQIYRHSLRLSFLLIKVPTPYGWMTSYVYTGGLSYVLGRPSESDVLRFFRPEIGWTVVDAGANIGYYTLIASKLVGSEGKVISIEPEPRNFSLLCRNIRDNHLSNVVPLQVALSDKDGYEELIMDASPSGHSIISNPNASGLNRRIAIRTRNIDSLLRGLNIEKVHLFKIDVEGAELRVLEGGKNALESGTSLIIESFNFDTIQTYLKNFGYNIKVIDSSNLFAWKEVTG